MLTSQSQHAFHELIEQRGLSLDGLTVEQGFAAMLDFYRHTRATDCPDLKDGDMLLYQWGVYPDLAGESFFELDLTRQLILGEGNDEDIWQLSLTFKFSPNDELRALEPGSKWCPTFRPRAVDYFEGFIKASPAYQAALRAKHAKVELDYYNGG